MNSLKIIFFGDNQYLDMKFYTWDFHANKIDLFDYSNPILKRGNVTNIQAFFFTKNVNLLLLSLHPYLLVASILTGNMTKGKYRI